MIDDTSKRYGPLDLPIFGGSSSAVERMEAEGQQQLVHSALLPADGSDGLAELGFTLGEIDPADPLFREVTLPDGWRKAGSDSHSLWSDVFDQHGRLRVTVFYKAAFYDRRAFCRVQSVYTYLQRLVLQPELPLVVDGTWCTPAAVAEHGAVLRVHLEQARASWAVRGDAESYLHAAEVTEQIEHLDRLIAQVRS